MEYNSGSSITSLRAGTDDDAAACASLWSEVVAARDGLSASHENEQRAIHKLVKRRISLVVATDDERLITGFSLLLPVEQGPNTATAHLSMLAVHPKIQARGLGRRLLNATHDAAAAQGIVELTLRVLSANEAARRLYESAGWLSAGDGHFQDSGRSFNHYRIFLANR